MPIYQYRREDGTTFEIRQKFLDDALEFDPETGQRVTRVIQPAGILFKGSGFYVTDNKGASRVTPNGNGNGSAENGSTENGNGKSSDTTESKSEAKSETKTEAKTETKKAESPTPVSSD